MNRIGKYTLSLFVVFSLTFLSCFVACMPSDNAIKEEVERMNETMPQDLGDGMMLVKIDFNEDGFVYVVECTGIPNVKLIKEHEKEIKHAMLENLKQSSRTNNETKALIEYCKKAHKTLSYKFIEKNNDEEVMITADPEEI